MCEPDHSHLSSYPPLQTTLVYINLSDNPKFDGMDYTPMLPFGRVIEGMDIVDQIYAGDGEKPNQIQYARQGTSYLKQAFPNLSYIRTAKLIGGEAADVPVPKDKEEI